MIFDDGNHYVCPAVWEEVDGFALPKTERPAKQPPSARDIQAALELAAMLVQLSIAVAPHAKTFWNDYARPFFTYVPKAVVEGVKKGLKEMKDSKQGAPSAPVADERPTVASDLVEDEHVAHRGGSQRIVVEATRAYRAA